MALNKSFLLNSIVDLLLVNLMLHIGSMVTSNATRHASIFRCYFYLPQSDNVQLNRFQNYGESSANYEPLIFQHEFASGGNQLNVYGSKSGISDQYEQTISGTGI